MIVSLPFVCVGASLPYTGAPWKHPHIHNFGNHGLGGAIHASVAPVATRLIDTLAYKGRDIRALLRVDDDADASTVDLGCGVGFSTSLHGVGVDASNEMLAVARCRKPQATFVRGLAERWGETGAYSRVTVSFLLHEQPQRRRLRILRNAFRISSDEVLVMDIHPSYKPSYTMRMGEPYVDEYLANIERDVMMLFGEIAADVSVTTHCDDRVVLYTIKKDTAT